MSKSKSMSPYLHTIDVVLLRFNRKDQAIEVLLTQRLKSPFASYWALPGLVVNGDTVDENLDQALNRLLMSSKVSMKPVYIEQVGTVGSATRDPRCWSSSTFYLGILNDTETVSLDQAFYPVKELLSSVNRMPFDHRKILESAMDRLESKSLYTSLPLVFLGSSVSLPASVDVFSCVLKRKMQKSSINQRLAKMLEAKFLIESKHKSETTVGRPHRILLNLNPGELFYFDRSFQRPPDAQDWESQLAC